MASPPPVTEYTRLYIAPFNPALLPSLVPPSILPHARNISFHTLETFPDKPYGYIELPIMDAAKISKKLKGTILKGSKIKIETARPKAEFAAEEAEPESKRTKNRKRKRDEIPAVELSDRSVKRGWTTPGKVEKRSGKKEDKKKGEKQKIKSKYTEGQECLFKTVLPPNIAAHAEKSKGRGNERTIHEFAKREKYASFLRGPAGEKLGKGVKEFIEGKGWVDEDGEVVEVVVKRRKTHRSSNAESLRSEDDQSKEGAEASSSGDEPSTENKEITKSHSKGRPTEEDEHSSSDDSSQASSSEENPKSDTIAAQAPHDSDTSTSGSSSPSESESESDSDSEGSSENESVPKSPESTTPIKNRPTSSSGLTISIPNSAITSTPIHPLEALYKKPKASEGTALEKSSFSFFGGDDENEEDDIVPEVHENLPFTPFTQREFEFRGQRSAAPTPDTAHANKRFLWPQNSSKDDSDDSSQNAPSSPIRKEDKGKGKGKGKEVAAAGEPGKDESDFTKWFYENRGDTNRAWKKRRKTVAKEKRQRENRKRGDRAN